MTIPIHNEHTSREEDNKAAILFAVRGCFTPKGFFVTSMPDTQKAARTSQRDIQDYFSNKKELPLDLARQNLGFKAVRLNATESAESIAQAFNQPEVLQGS